MAFDASTRRSARDNAVASAPAIAGSVGNMQQAAFDCLDRKDQAYKEMLSIALTQLHEAQAAHRQLQARYDALKDELRRYTASQCEMIP